MPSERGDFGIEAIEKFHALDAATNQPEEFNVQLHYMYDITNGLHDELAAAGYTPRFYYTERDCWELDLRSAEFGGLDAEVADSVDLFFIGTHGNLGEAGSFVSFDTPRDDWNSWSTHWRLGDGDLEWLALFGCHSIDHSNPGLHWDVFQGLHLMLGSWRDMHTGWTLRDVGCAFAHDLLDGDTVAAAWIGGVGDWWVDNHPAVLSAERASTWNDGRPRRARGTMARDHFPGRGTTVRDVRPDQLAWIDVKWATG
jgi:Family of unknown function (DUF6345)